VTPSSIDRRIFIVGVPRSGTTLLQSLLAGHSEIASYTESHFFSRHFHHIPVRSLPVLTGDPTPRVREFLAENGEAPTTAAARLAGGNRWLLRVKPLRPMLTRPVASRLVQLLDELTQRRGHRNWIEKTPRHIRYIPLIQGACPTPPLFVHIVRDGLDVVDSLHAASQHWERPYDVDHCARRWNEEVQLSLDRIEQPNHHVVVYERLVTKPEATLRRLTEWLGLPFETDMLASYGETANRLVTRNEPWKSNVGRPIGRPESTRRSLTREQRDRALELLRRDRYDRIVEQAERRVVHTDGAH